MNAGILYLIIINKFILIKINFPKEHVKWNLIQELSLRTMLRNFALKVNMVLKINWNKNINLNWKINTINQILTRITIKYHSYNN